MTKRDRPVLSDLPQSGNTSPIHSPASKRIHAVKIQEAQPMQGNQSSCDKNTCTFMKGFAASLAGNVLARYQIDIKTFDSETLPFVESKIKSVMADIAFGLKDIESYNRCSCFADISNFIFECVLLDALGQSMRLPQLIKRVRRYLDHVEPPTRSS